MRDYAEVLRIKAEMRNKSLASELLESDQIVAEVCQRIEKSLGHQAIEDKLQVLFIDPIAFIYTFLIAWNNKYGLDYKIWNSSSVFGGEAQTNHNIFSLCAKRAGRAEASDSRLVTTLGHNSTSIRRETAHCLIGWGRYIQQNITNKYDG